METTTELHIDTTRLIGPRSPLLFGHFLEHFHRQIYGGIYSPGSPLADEHGFRRDVVAALRRLRPSVIRWPGGCFVSAYHWRDGVGAGRTPSFDKAWRVEEPNSFGTDEFIDFCRAVGAEPYLCTNAGTAGPEEGSDWLEYCNLRSEGRWARQRIANGHPEPHAVRYWSVGNENYGFWELGAKDADEWSRYVAEAAKMMRRVDGSVVLSAATTDDLEWNVKLLQRAGRYLDLVSLHAYLAHSDTPYSACIARSQQIEVRLSHMEHVLGALKLSDRVRIAFDEWNPRFWHHPSFLNRDPQISERDRNDEHATYTMADAILHACFLNACLRHCRSVEITNFSPVVNTRGAIFTHPDGLVLRSTYHVCDLYANHTFAEVVDAHCSSPAFMAREDDGSEVAVPLVDSCVTLDRAGGQLAIAAVNLHPDLEVPIRVWLPGHALSHSAVVRTVTAASIDSYNSPDHPNAVGVTVTKCASEGDTLTVLLAAHSVNVITLRVGAYRATA